MENKEIEIEDVQKQKNEWRKKGWWIQDLRGRKHQKFELVKSLIELVGREQANDLDTYPDIKNIDDVQTWRTYAPFLRGVGLVNNQSGKLILSQIGIEFYGDPTKIRLANLLQDKTRLFGEVLDNLNESSATVEEVNKSICTKYGLHWKNLTNIRRRMDWLEVLDLIQPIGNRKWEITETGKLVLNDWCIVSPDAICNMDIENDDIAITEAPVEISNLLNKLTEFPEFHKKRCTYNLWVPSPNKIENLRIITQACINRITRNELFDFIEKEFNLRLGSVESMLPFLKASGLLQEVGRNIYKATPAANAWLETGNDLDFIRILHAHMKFVGEILKIAYEDIVRNDIYEVSEEYGMNSDKSRWIIGFLLEAGLLEETQYLHIKTTSIGNLLANELPLEKIEKKDVFEETVKNSKDVDAMMETYKIDYMISRIRRASTDPFSDGKKPGLAFEESIANLFSYMGFQAEHIGGSGDTDVVLRWKDSEDNNYVAIVDGKSKSNGQVSHSDISDVAIDTHKEKNNADYVVIVGPGFSGDTIRNFAIKKNYALITDEQLVEIAKVSKEIGLSANEIAQAFQMPNGFSQLEEKIEEKKREFDIISEIVKKFSAEQNLLGSLSPRDLFLLLRNSKLSPSLDELICGFQVLSNSQIGILKKVDKNSILENERYVMNSVEKTVSYLRALASSIEQGIV